MSKSYNNTLPIFEPAKSLRKMIMRITTDSRPLDQPKDPDTDHLYQLFKLLAPASDVQEMADLYRRGGFGYGDIKKKLADAADAFFDTARQRRSELEAHPDHVLEILRQGAERARQKASAVLRRAEKACGLSLEIGS
jgi:tryptophanyl-tRNA synthetase